MRLMLARWPFSHHSILLVLCVELILIQVAKSMPCTQMCVKKLRLGPCKIFALCWLVERKPMLLVRLVVFPPPVPLPLPLLLPPPPPPPPSPPRHHHHMQLHKRASWSTGPSHDTKCIRTLPSLQDSMQWFLIIHDTLLLLQNSHFNLHHHNRSVF